jgi:hypothetical protein
MCIMVFMAMLIQAVQVHSTAYLHGSLRSPLGLRLELSTKHLVTGCCEHANGHLISSR